MADVAFSDVDEPKYLSLERLQLSDANHICARPSLQILHDALVLFVLCRAEIKSKFRASHELWRRLGAHYVACGGCIGGKCDPAGCTGLHFLTKHIALGAVNVKPSLHKP